MSVLGSGRLNIDLIYGGLERLPDIGEEVYSKSFSMHLGGGTPGTLINLKRLNVDVKLFTYLGEDFFSDFCKKEMSKCQMSYANFHEEGEFPINISSALLTKDDRTFVSYGENCKPSIKCEEALCNEGVNYDYVIMELDEYKEAYKYLKEKGVKLVMDPGYTKDLTLNHYKEYLELADFYLPNRKESLELTRKSTVEEAGRVLSEFFDEVIIKLDKDGVYYYKNQQSQIIKGCDRFRHKDSTGAGDAFLAGFLYGLSKGFDTRKSLMCGNLTGGKCVTEYGCLTAYFTEKELLSLLEEFWKGESV